MSKHKKIIILIFIIFFLLLCSFLIYNKRNNFKTTVNKNEVLSVNEMKGKYNFKLKFNSINNNYPLNEWFYKGNATSVNLSIENVSKDELDLNSLIGFKLINSNGDIVGTWNNFLSLPAKNSIQQIIKSGETATGNVYFYDMSDDGEAFNIDNSDISKLQISVVKELTKKDGKITGNYRRYYIDLK